MNSEKRLVKVYTIVDKPGSQKSIWLEIGVGSHNRDGSISAKLDALPVTGTIHLRDFEPNRNRSSAESENTQQKPENDEKPV